MSALYFGIACVAIAALLLCLDRRIQNSSPAAPPSPAAGEDTTPHDPKVRYWLTPEGYAALAELEEPGP